MIITILIITLDSVVVVCWVETAVERADIEEEEALALALAMAGKKYC